MLGLTLTGLMKGRPAVAKPTITFLDLMGQLVEARKNVLMPEASDPEVWVMSENDEYGEHYRVKSVGVDEYGNMCINVATAAFLDEYRTDA